MIDWNLSIADMRMVVAIRDILRACGEAAPTLGQLKIALQERNFTLGNGMPRELDDLEMKLGGPEAVRKLLVDRRKSGAVMLPRGLEIAAYCERMLSLLKEMEDLAASGRQTLRIGVTNAITINMLPKVFLESEFLAKLPNTDIEIIEAESWELVTTLFTSVEFAIGSRDLIPSDCRAESLCRRKRVLLYNPTKKYRHDYSQPVSVECVRDWLRDETLIVPAARIVPELRTFLLPMRSGRTIMVPTAASRRNWVERGVGVAISHEEKSAELNRNAQLATFDLSEVLGETELMFFFHKTRRLSPAAELLVKLIRLMFEDSPYPTISQNPPDPRFADRPRSW